MGPKSSAEIDYINLINNVDPIIACATNCISPSGIAVIRLSGHSLRNIILGSVRHLGPIGPLDSPRRAILADLFNPTSTCILDRCLVTFFNSPSSFTGEDVLEISVHGNPLLVSEIINMFKENFNFRDAYAGEFSLRAYKNKKLSLSQIEGLDALLHANTQPLIELSRKVLSGEQNFEFNQLCDFFDLHSASIDILTDFSEDVGLDDGLMNFRETWKNLFSLINSLYERTKIPIDVLLKPSIVLYGPPNAGKSTLFNLMLGYSRSIVSPESGTTRDYIREDFLISNNRFSLVDTAGIRETDSSVESRGIFFTKDQLLRAYAKILVISYIDFSFDELKKFLSLCPPTFIIISHFDVNSEISDFKKMIFSMVDCPVYFTDFISDKGILDKIKGPILTDYLGYFDKKPIIFKRQIDEIGLLYDLSLRYTSIVSNDFNDIGIISSEFNLLRSSANRLIGVIDVDRVLGLVFTNFCIGK